MPRLELDPLLYRSFSFCVSKRKILFTLPIVSLSGLIYTSFRTLSSGTSEWIQLSFSFLPVFVIASLLLAAGLILIRAYHNEIKGIPFSYRKLTAQSWDLMVAFVYFTLPLTMLYVVLWSLVGFFYLFKEIPWIGPLVSFILSFMPLLLVLTFILLSIAYIAVIFFFSPAVALKSECSLQMLKSYFVSSRRNLLNFVSLLLVALLPILGVLGLLFISSAVISSGQEISNSAFTSTAHSLLNSFVYSVFCTPAVIFFFNFSAESYVFIKKRAQK
ncbi:MAG: hypothetical protein EBZ47_04750 [Chlamydiae bacterium]|nr:hypothetical protein [Chlamydiota bacterium]